MLRFCDSFDHYARADLLSKWTSAVGAGSQITTVGRNSTNGFRSRSLNTESVTVQLDSRQEWWVGFAFAMNANTIAIRIADWLDAASRQFGIASTAAGVLAVDRNGSVLDTGTTVLTAGLHYYIELYLLVGNAGVGAYELKINGITEFSDAGVDTQNTANATANQFRIGKDASNAINSDYDDIYIVDDQGSAPNDTFLGDVRVQALFPNGNGNSSVFLGSDGNSTDNYLLVDETANDGDTTYVQGSTVGDKDTYAFTDPTPGSGTVYGVQILPYARKTDAGVRDICTVARLSGTETDGPNQTLSTGYTYLDDIRETKPGGGAWTISDVTSAEFGVKVTA